MLDWDSGLTGKPIALRPHGFGAMAKSLRILADGSRESISAVIGANHKVRSFYNNLIAPYSTSGDVTIDTHAVAAAHLLPLGSSDDLVAQTFGGGNVGKPASKSSDLTGLMGNYAFYAEAYRRAAAAKGVLPREMQSRVTWEAVRGLFRPEQKVALKGSVAKIWERYGKGEMDENQARAETLKVAGGVAPPKWAGSAAGSTEATRASSYAEELPQAGAPGGGAAPDSVGTDGRGAGGTEDLAPRGPGSPAFERWFGDSKVVDADGNPMPVYHGTDAEFDAFDTTDFGSWFAERPETADKYTDRDAEAARRGDLPAQEILKRSGTYVGIAIAGLINLLNPSTVIKFGLPKASHVSLNVYDMMGRQVSVLVNERKDAGVHESKIEGSNLASGVYVYRLQGGDFVQSKPLVLLK